MPREIDLLRHGAVVGGPGFRGRLDDPLTLTGWRQMARAVKDGRWQRVISSPRQRCRVFAEALTRRHGLPLIIDPDLAEMDFGDWEGCTAAELYQRYPEQLSRFWHSPSRYPPPGAELSVEFERRVIRAWQRLLQSDCQRQLVISHGGPIRLLLCKRDGQPFDRLLSYPVDYGSLHRLTVERS